MQDLFDRTLAIVDIETTGLGPRWDRIIEICIIRVENGEVVDKLDTLINPQTYLSPFIESITGIKREDLEDAPLFLEYQERVTELLDGALFIAHNVNFDYSFIREELKRLGVQYSSKTLCTARLSRKLFPQYRSHNLTSIIERFGFECKNRHRAYDDAYVLYQFLQQVKKDLPPEEFDSSIQTVMKNVYSSNEYLTGIIEDLPESPGVYLFYDKEGLPLYIGKSTNIKERVKSHFTPSINNVRELSIFKNISHIEYIKTAGELGALLKESEKIKELQPLYNRRLRLKKKFIAVMKDITHDGFETFKTQTIENFDGISFENLFGIFRTKKSINETLSEFAKKYSLCPKILGIEHSSSSCFEYKLGRCKGACIGKEGPEKYNRRFLIAFIENKQFQSWKFDGPVEIIEKNDEEGMFESFLVDNWCLIGKRNDEYEFNFTKDLEFDLDSYKILSSHLKYKKATVKPYLASQGVMS